MLVYVKQLSTLALILLIKVLLNVTGSWKNAKFRALEGSMRHLGNWTDPCSIFPVIVMELLDDTFLKSLALLHFLY